MSRWAIVNELTEFVKRAIDIDIKNIISHSRVRYNISTKVNCCKRSKNEFPQQFSTLNLIDYGISNLRMT